MEHRERCVILHYQAMMGFGLQEVQSLCFVVISWGAALIYHGFL